MSDLSPALLHSGDGDDGPVPEPEQRLLFELGAELLTVEEDARKGKYSGAIIEKNREKVKAICGALAEGHGIIRVAKAFGVSTHTVIGIRERHPDLLAIEEKQLTRKYGTILALSAERYLEALVSGSIPAAQLPVGMGIVFDKKALLDGKPTAIVRHQAKEISIEDLNALIEGMPRANVVEESSEGSAESESDDGGSNAQ